MTAAVVVGLLGAAALGWFIYLAFSAPLGWEDEKGFHEGERQSHDEGYNS